MGPSRFHGSDRRTNSHFWRTQTNGHLRAPALELRQPCVIGAPLTIRLKHDAGQAVGRSQCALLVIVLWHYYPRFVLHTDICDGPETVLLKASGGSVTTPPPSVGRSALAPQGTYSAHDFRITERTLASGAKRPPRRSRMPHSITVQTMCSRIHRTSMPYRGGRSVAGLVNFLTREQQFIDPSLFATSMKRWRHSPGIHLNKRKSERRDCGGSGCYTTTNYPAAKSARGREM